MTPLLVTIDLDDAWAYLRARNESRWQEAPTVLPLTIDRLREVLTTAGIGAATMFVVGQDARRPEGRAAIRAAGDEGWEIGDHSLAHRGELARLPRGEIARDLIASRDAIGTVTGTLPSGFRCPSFGSSRALTMTLRQLGYRYDASPLPTTLVPLLRAYHRVTAGRGEHTPTYGTWRGALAPLRPQRRDGLVVIPTTTLPLLRLPFHGSYLTAVASRSPAAARGYAGLADRLCRSAGVPVSFLLHPTDVLDRDDAPQLAFFPGMSVPWRRKRRLLVAVLRRFARGRQIMTLTEAAGTASPAMWR